MGIGTLIRWIVGAIMQFLESRKAPIFKKSKNRIESLQKNITLTKISPHSQKKQSKKLMKHSKFYLIEEKENNTIWKYLIFTMQMIPLTKKKRKIYQIKCKGIHIILQNLNLQVILVSITCF